MSGSLVVLPGEEMGLMVVLARAGGVHTLGCGCWL